MQSEKDLINEVINTYEFGWNITRAALVGKQTYFKKTLTGVIQLIDPGTLRDMEAERLFQKYHQMSLKNEQRNYCDGALDLIREWDRIGKCPLPQESFEEDYEGEFENEDEDSDED